MEIEQIINPITMPEYPDPAEARRFIHDEYGFYGYDYVFLEDATWNALREIAIEQGSMADELCRTIGDEFPDADFAQAARYYVLRHIAAIPGNIELPGNFRVLTELRATHRCAQ
jgi:Ribbon-helix-helix domain